MNVDALYSLERALLSYKGMRFTGVMDQAVLAHEDEEGRRRVVLDAWAQNIRVLRFEGPEFDGSRVGVMVPVANDIVEIDRLGDVIDFESLAEAMIEQVKDAD